ncbi:hypothetical protein HMPREF0083_02030 [Aneurinibacillus aneurinilyticus ATCC 12856]|uniref:BclA C-terminal domain-containing protein n=2 Tax=Aneurinibacillus aneurinilyticus TaxID=1391 RepID=U1X4I8_ANEAE|nr:hypothetical protein HMPREF0083_02030 [Aneurinibacillus aneurinilyticus ATCC 12856]
MRERGEKLTVWEKFSSYITRIISPLDATATSMYASNTGGSTILVVAGGINVALPNNQNLESFTVNSGNTIFTVPANGRYYLAYQINTTTALLVGARLTRNGTPIPGSILSPAVATSSYNNNVIISLNVGDTIALQLFGLVATAVLVGGGSAGAALTIIRLS